jgi:nucleotide-binding universal stress UspA family protein
MSTDVTEPAVVAGVDHTSMAPVVLRYAATEAERYGLPLRIVHVVTLFGGEQMAATHPRDERAALMMRRHVRELGRVVPQARRTTTSFELRHGSAIGELMVVAAPGSRLVVGADRREPGRTAGVVAGALAARVECPLTVVPRLHGGAEQVARIVVGFKDLWESSAALDAGIDEAARRGVELLVVHASTTGASPTRVELERLLELRAEATSGVRARVRLVYGDVVAAVDAIVEPADLLVLGRPLGPLTHPDLGAVDAALLRAARCPVLIAPPALAHETQPRGTGR